VCVCVCVCVSRLQNCKKRLLAFSSPSVRMEQLGSKWTDFRQIYVWVRKMYQLDANNFTMIFSHKWPLHVSDIYMSIFRSSYIYRMFHCRMWCYAIGVEAVVLRSWCVVLCTVCQLVCTVTLISNLYLSIFRKSVEKIQVWLKSYRSNEYFTWRHVYFFMSLCIILRMKNVPDKSLQRKSKPTFYAK